MEIPEISFLSNFQAGVNYLQNPSIVSRLFTLFSMEIYNLWKWSAVIIAVFTAFKKLKLLFIRFRGKVTPSLEQFVEHLVYDFELTDDDDDEDDEDDESSSISSLEDFSEDESDEDFRGEKGQKSNNSRMGDRRLSWTDFTAGSSVVKLWDGFEESYKNIVSIWDSNTFFDFDWGSEHQEYDDVVAQPTLTAEVNPKRNGVVLSGYDRRMRGGKPAVFADWDERANGVEEVHVRNGINGVLMVGDLRSTKTPLKTVRLRRSNGDAFGNAD